MHTQLGAVGSVSAVQKLLHIIRQMARLTDSLLGRGLTNERTRNAGWRQALNGVEDLRKARQYLDILIEAEIKSEAFARNRSVGDDNGNNN